MLAERLKQYALLMRLHRPIGIFLLLWPSLWALWFAAGGWPHGLVLFVFVAGVILMRSAGCVINDYADRNFDPHVARTRDRPIAAGKVNPNEALMLFVVLGLVAFALVCLMNGLTIALSVVGALLAASYPFTKRYTHLPQAYLGIAFGWGVPMAYAAQLGEVPAAAWILFAATVSWALAYDTEYAMVDRDDDVKIGVKSTAILFGQWDRVWVLAFHVLTLALLAWAGLLDQRGAWFYAGLAAAGGLALYQQWLIRHRTRERCFQAFLNNNRFGAVIFLGLAIDLGL